MNIIINLSILVSVFVITYMLVQVYNYIDYKWEQFQFKKFQKGEIYKKRVEKVSNISYRYYLDLALNEPSLLAYELASREVREMKANGLINSRPLKLARAK